MATDVLVDSARTMGEPLDLHRAASRGHSFSDRLCYQHAVSTASYGRFATRPNATTALIHQPIRIIGRTDHGDSSDCRDFLFSRRPIRRAPRPQHSFLEVASGFRSHSRALETRNSPSDSAASQFCYYSCDSVPHDRAEQRNFGGEWRERGIAMDRRIVHSRFTGDLVSPAHSTWPVVRATLWLATAGICLGTARAFPMGVPAAICDVRRGEGRLQHFAFSRFAPIPFARARKLNGAGARRERIHGNAHTGAFFKHSGPVDRAGCGSGLPLCSSSAAAISGPNLI